MITSLKIISDGQQGAALAALDAAIELGVAHGGWAPAKRSLVLKKQSNRYNLQSLHQLTHEDCVRRNILQADGTLIISDGPLPAPYRWSLEFSTKRNKPCLEINLAEAPEFLAAGRIIAWVFKNQIEEINVIGPTPEDSTDIYQTTKDIFSTALYMAVVKDQMHGPRAPKARPGAFAKDHIVEDIISQLSLKDRVALARLPQGDIHRMHSMFRAFILKQVGPACDEDEYLGLIDQLWHRLKSSHGLRRVK